MPLPGRNFYFYHLLLGAGIAIMVLALCLSFTLTIPSGRRFAIVALIGLAGYGVSTLARKFKRPS